MARRRVGTTWAAPHQEAERTIHVNEV